MNAVDQSEVSDAIQIMAAQVANPPTNLEATASSDISITIEWVTPVLDGGTPVTDFKIFWNAGIDNGNFVEL